MASPSFAAQENDGPTAPVHSPLRSLDELLGFMFPHPALTVNTSVGTHALGLSVGSVGAIDILATRKRLGLLFSTNSIWNDDAVLHLPLHALASSYVELDHTPALLFLSPTLAAQPTRNRSHTTSATVHPLSEPRVLPFMAPKAESLFELVLGPDTGRNRAQTFLGGPEPVRMVVPSCPHLDNDYDFAAALIVTNFENPALGPTNTLLFDNVPAFIDAARLWHLLGSSQGLLRVQAVRMGALRMALVELVLVEAAMLLKANFDHLEIVPGTVLYVAFAKVEAPVAPAQDRVLMHAARLLLYCPASSRKILLLVAALAAFGADFFQLQFAPLPDPLPSRHFDSPRLRELRKTLEGEGMLQADLEELCVLMLPELPELCYDHIGNTVVQKVFSVVQLPCIRLLMVKEVAPYLAQLSTHKNGTWAVQKILNLASGQRQQMVLVARSLRPYAVKLFNDQFGNYVLQCCLRFGLPYNDFVFETLCSHFLDICYGRFGVRCVRTMLELAGDESCGISPEQVVLVAALIVEHATELAVHSNGLLLVTWFLDTFAGAGDYDPRYELLCGKFAPHLAALCTHKLASLTMSKIVANRSDARARQAVMDLLFPYSYDDARSPSTLLETVLAETPDNAGPMFVHRLLTTPQAFAVGDERALAQYQLFVVEQVRRVLLETSIVNIQPFKKLLDEVGLAGARLNNSPPTGRRGKRGRKHLPHHPPAGLGGPAFAHDYFDQDQSVMQQLEQLLMSLAAMGYLSNPQTPSGRTVFD